MRANLGLDRPLWLQYVTWLFGVLHGDFGRSMTDGLPIIGQGEFEGLYFLTGHGPSGIAPLPGSIALLMALIAGEDPPVSPEPFDPLRFGRSE